MTVTGRPAQFGRGVMAEVGGRIIGKFASNLAAQLSGEGAAAASAGEASPAASAGAAGTGAAGTGAASTGPASTGPASTAAASAGAGANGLAADAAQLPIEELNLPVRSFNSLRREGVHTVGGLASRTEKELLAIDGLGPQSIKEIKSRLADHGMTLTTPGVTVGETAAAEGTAAAGSGTAAEAAGPATAVGTGGPRPAPVSAASPGGRAGTWDAEGTAADRSAANGLLPPRSARPQDEDALDLLSVAGLPLLKRVAPLVGALLVVGVLFRVLRRRRRASRA